MRVLVTSSGSTNGVNVIKALNGFDLVACDCDELSVGNHMVSKSYMVPSATEYGFIDKIISICRTESIDIIIPTFSKELPIFSQNKGLFEKNGIKIAISEPSQYEWTENKLKCNAFLNIIGVDIPNQNPDNFPMIVKPIVGSGSKNIFIVKNPEELKFYKNDTNFCEELIIGTEYTIDGVSDLSGKMICAMPRIRIEKKGGLATKSKTVKNDKLVELVKKIVERFRLIGAFNVQCIERCGKYYFIDVNNRFPSGGMPLAVASGMNMPKIIIDVLMEKKPDIKLEYGKTMLRYYESIII